MNAAPAVLLIEDDRDYVDVVARALARAVTGTPRPVRYAVKGKLTTVLAVTVTSGPTTAIDVTRKAVSSREDGTART